MKKFLILFLVVLATAWAGVSYGDGSAACKAVDKSGTAFPRWLLINSATQPTACYLGEVRNEFSCYVTAIAGSSTKSVYLRGKLSDTSTAWANITGANSIVNTDTGTYDFHTVEGWKQAGWIVPACVTGCDATNTVSIECAGRSK